MQAVEPTSHCWTLHLNIRILFENFSFYILCAIATIPLPVIVIIILCTSNCHHITHIIVPPIDDRPQSRPRTQKRTTDINQELRLGGDMCKSRGNIEHLRNFALFDGTLPARMVTEYAHLARNGLTGTATAGTKSPRHLSYSQSIP